MIRVMCSFGELASSSSGSRRPPLLLDETGGKVTTPDVSIHNIIPQARVRVSTVYGKRARREIKRNTTG